MSYTRFFTTLWSLFPSEFRLIFLASLFVNLLFLISPIYMMHIYDTVIGSNSEVNLAAISIIAAFLYCMFFGFDLIRSKLLLSLAPSIESGFDRYARSIFEKKKLEGEKFIAAAHSLDRLQQFMLAPVVAAFFDLPFAPIFICLAFLIHPLLGGLGVAGTVCVLAIALAFGRRNDLLLKDFESQKRAEGLFGKSVLAQHEFVRTTHARDFILGKWSEARRVAQDSQLQAAGTNAGGLSLTKTLRLAMQSAVLGAGAWLVLHQSLSPGAIIAASVVISRALMPIEQVVAARRSLRLARSALETLIETRPEAEDGADSRQPAKEDHLANASIQVRNLSYQHEGAARPLFRNLSFAVKEGQCCAITGPNGCGKTTLLRCILGLLEPQKGTVHIGGVDVRPATIDRIAAGVRYLPQQNELFPLTIYENIALSDADSDRKAVIGAAKEVGCHSAIMSLDDHYDTKAVVGQEGRLSPGFVQSIALARTIVGKPRIVLFDEPLLSLDNAAAEKFRTVLEKLKKRGTTVMMVTHDPRIFSLSDVLLMFHPVAGPLFGPTKEILTQLRAIETKAIAQLKTGTA